MTQISLKYAELHSALFFKGANLGLKLNPIHRHGLILNYDREARELLVSYQGETAIVPTTNVVAMVPGDVKPDHSAAPAPVPVIKMDAQVSSPIHHVFAGAGHGKTGKNK